MRKEDAKAAIIQEWDSWKRKNLKSDHKATGRDGLIFFGYLRQERPDLLTFKSSGDRWQVVHGWLMRERRVAD